MITINLLPEEYRRPTRSPLRLLIAGSVSLTMACSLLAWWAWLVFGVCTDLETQAVGVETELSGLRPQVAYHQALRKESAFHAAREATLATITSSRVLWTQVLDDLTSVVNQGHEGDRHTIWFDNVSGTVEDSVVAGRGGFGKLEASGHSGSGEIDQISSFLSDLSDSEASCLPALFGPPSAPEGNRNEGDEGVVPQVDFSFPLHLDLLGPNERQRPSAAGRLTQSSVDSISAIIQ